MLHLTCKEGRLLVNWRHELVRLNSPFQRITDERSRKRGKAHLTMAPSQTFTESQRPRAYRISFKNQHQTAALFVSGSRGLQSQLLYDTNRHISALFREKALHSLLNNLDADAEPYPAIRRYLRIMLNVLCASYPFDGVLTDIPALHGLELDLPVVQKTWNLVKVPPSRLTWFCTYCWLVERALRAHQAIPLPCLDGRVLRDIDLAHTDFRSEDLGGHTKMLFVTGTNTFYAGFIARELRNRGYQEVLPVTLFGIKRCKRNAYETGQVS